MNEILIDSTNILCREACGSISGKQDIIDAVDYVMHNYYTGDRFTILRRGDLH